MISFALQKKNWSLPTDLADAFIQSDLQCIQAIHLYCQYVCSLGIKPTTFALLTQCSNHWATVPVGQYIHEERLDKWVKLQIWAFEYEKLILISSGGQSTQIKYLSKSTDTYNKILLH